MYIDVFYFAIIINWTYSVVAFLNFLIFFFSKYKGLPEARTAAEPVGEIREGLQD